MKQDLVLITLYVIVWAYLVAQVVKNLPAVQG